MWRQRYENQLLTIDTGTTNTRISLIKGETLCDTLKVKVGVGDTKKKPGLLQATIKEGISTILSRNNLSAENVEGILACGMITSELGLCKLEPLKTPCGIEELARELRPITIPEISPLPFFFIRGVMMQGNDFETTDIMRGEETELIGLTDHIEPNCLYILPGSHSKRIQTDSKGRIASFCTELTGELMSAIADGTILSQTIDLSIDVEIDNEYLKMGYHYAREHGLTAAFFKVRILQNMFGCTKPQLYGFFKGVALCPEIENIRKTGIQSIVVAGKAQLRNPMYTILQDFSDRNISAVPDAVSDHATAMGMIKIFRFAKELHSNRRQADTP